MYTYIWYQGYDDCQLPLSRGSDGPARHLRRVYVRLPGKGIQTPMARGRPNIITLIKWIRTSRLSIQNALSLTDATPLPGSGVPSPGGEGAPSQASKTFPLKSAQGRAKNWP